MVSEKDLQSYLKVAASALPCREARKEFSSYVHNVAHDIQMPTLLLLQACWEPRLNKSLQISWKVNRRKQYHGGIALHIVTNMACNY